MLEFDYIIVGAGSAGCVLANKLTADGRNTVLLLEAGPMDRNLMIHVPAGVYHAYRNPAINWNYQSEAESFLFDRHIEAPRGKVIGGSSSINSMVYMRGHPTDYDNWSRMKGLPDWSYDRCLPYFKAEESSDRGADDWRGESGPLGVSKGTHDSPLYDAFLEAGGQAGQGTSEDLNGFRPEGVARFDATRKNGRRCSAAVAYLHPARGRKNLTVKTGVHVHKVNLDEKQATGVTFRLDGQLVSAEARKEVILSGGATNTPQLLMLSGIGPGDHLRSHGIDVLHDLPGVGKNLQDHVTVVLVWRCREAVTMDYASDPLQQAMIGLRWLFTRKGMGASNVWEAGGLICSNNDVAIPNIQYHFGPVGAEEVNGKLKLFQAFSIHVDQLRPQSRGEVLLRSANPEHSPALHFNYLTKQHDLKELIEGVKKARDLVAQPAFDRYRGEEVAPGVAVQSDSDIGLAIRKMSGTDYHPCGTCRMGNGDDAVVDGEMRVHGIAGLRVVDASVMPQIISANLNAPTQMIAARAADYILGNPQRVPSEATFHFC